MNKANTNLLVSDAVTQKQLGNLKVFPNNSRSQAGRKPATSAGLAAVRSEHSGKSNATANINRAICEYKQAEAALRRAEEKYRGVFEKLAKANQEVTLLYERLKVENERLKVENYRLRAELEVTRRLQQMLLPKPHELNQITNLEIAGFMEPATEISGDYYDVLQHNGLVKISIGDVTGHGLESGMLMIMVQTIVRTLLVTHELLASPEADPAKFLNILNRTIYENVQRMNSDKTLTFAWLDYQEGNLNLSGQHEEVIVVRSGGKVERIDTIDLGFPIGLEADIINFVAQIQIPLNSGDVVVLFTDGIVEAENMEGLQYGLERLCETVGQHWQQSAEEINQTVIADVRQHIGEQKIYDDITLLVLKQK